MDTCWARYVSRISLVLLAKCSLGGITNLCPSMLTQNPCTSTECPVIPMAFKVLSMSFAYAQWAGMVFDDMEG